MADAQAAERHPFVFWKMAFLVEVLPLRALSLGQLLPAVTLAPNLSIFYHLHQQFFHDPALLPPYPNDFAAWVDMTVGDALVAERLANLNLSRSVNLVAVRREISVILAEHLQQGGEERHAPRGEEFIFCQPRSVGFSTGRLAHTPQEFLEVLRTLDSDSIGYHLFVPRTAPARADNDFAAWFRYLGYEELAQHIDDFDPYLNSLEDNRIYLIELIENGLRSSSQA